MHNIHTNTRVSKACLLRNQQISWQDADLDRKHCGWQARIKQSIFHAATENSTNQTASSVFSWNFQASEICTLIGKTHAHAVNTVT
jgi:hypothetical protein